MRTKIRALGPGPCGSVCESLVAPRLVVVAPSLGVRMVTAMMAAATTSNSVIPGRLGVRVPII